MLNLLKMFGFNKRSKLEVDFNKAPTLPNGTTEIKEHKPVGTGVMTLTKEDFLLLQMPADVSYAEYRKKHINEPLGDALILDCFIDLVRQQGKSWGKMMNEVFGIKQGQIFFLGTTYVGINGKEVVPYLNINTDAPALKYVYPINNIIRCYCPLYSCELTLPQ
mgnify:FL=1